MNRSCVLAAVTALCLTVASPALAAAEGPTPPGAAGSPAAEQAFDRGVAALQAGDNAGAVAQFDQVIADPKTAGGTLMAAHYARGIARGHLNDLQGALSDYTVAIERSPDPGAEVYTDRAKVYVRLGDAPKAFADFEKAQKLDPDYPELYAGRGTLHLDRNELALALADFDRAAALKSEDLNVYSGRAAAHSRLGQYAAAVTDWNEILSRKPNDPQAHFWRGRNYYMLARYDLAFADADKALQLGLSGDDAARAKTDRTLARRELDKARTAGKPSRKQGARAGT